MRLLILVFCVAAVQPARALDRVVIDRGGSQKTLLGKRVVAAQDGGLLLLAPEGVLWSIEPSEIVEHTQNNEPFIPLSAADMGADQLAQLPPGFDVHTTARYVVCYNTSRAYARWTGALLERLHAAFTNFWRRRGFRLERPDSPLVVVVFADVTSYRAHARAELGEAAESVVGYYSLRTNRVTMYDLTGDQALSRTSGRRASAAQVNRMLSRPEAAPLVATVVHEATHQIAYNCGLLVRYADTPLWINEGLAIYFETPDLASATGWRGIGQVNRPRLATFRANLGSRGPKSLESLIADDRRMRNVRLAGDAYAEAWAFHYFLIRKRPRQYGAYLRMLSEKEPLVWNDRETRLAEFRRFFGHDLTRLDAELLRYMEKVR